MCTFIKTSSCIQFPSVDYASVKGKRQPSTDRGQHNQDPIQAGLRALKPKPFTCETESLMLPDLTLTPFSSLSLPLPSPSTSVFVKHALTKPEGFNTLAYILQVKTEGQIPIQGEVERSKGFSESRSCLSLVACLLWMPGIFNHSYFSFILSSWIIFMHSVN